MAIAITEFEALCGFKLGKQIYDVINFLNPLKNILMTIDLKDLLSADTEK